MKQLFVVPFFLLSFAADQTQLTVEGRHISELLENALIVHLIKSNSFQEVVDSTGHLYMKNYEYRDFFVEKGCRPDFIIDRIDSKALSIPNYYLYSVDWNNKAIRCSDGMVKEIITTHTSVNELLSAKYLVAYDLENKKIMYIAGDFYKSRIADYFNLTNSTSAEFESFLMLKLYNYSLSRIKFISFNNGSYQFTAFSTCIGKMITISVNSKDLDWVVVNY